MILGCPSHPQTPPAGAGAYANMSAPPRTTVQAHQLPVSGRALSFCTELVCVHLGLLPGPGRESAHAEARRRWNGDIAPFLAEVHRLGLDHDGPGQRLRTWPGPVIGWVPTMPLPHDPFPSAVCIDLAWTLAVLSRVEGRLLLPQRRPRLTWRHLFGEPFALDDARLADVVGVPRPQIGAPTAPEAKP